MNNKRRLSEYKRAVLTTITMRLTRKEAVAYLQAEGYPISNATLGRIKSELRRNSLQRMHQVAAYEFHQQHLNRIDNCELICKLMWENYLRERSPYRRVLILKEIKELQPYLSSYYEATKMVLGSKYGTLGENNLNSKLKEALRLGDEPVSQCWTNSNSDNPNSRDDKDKDKDRGNIPPVR